MASDHDGTLNMEAQEAPKIRSLGELILDYEKSQAAPDLVRQIAMGPEMFTEEMRASHEALIWNFARAADDIYSGMDDSKVGKITVEGIYRMHPLRYVNCREWNPRVEASAKKETAAYRKALEKLNDADNALRKVVPYLKSEKKTREEYAGHAAVAHELGNWYLFPPGWAQTKSLQTNLKRFLLAGANAELAADHGWKILENWRPEFLELDAENLAGQLREIENSWLLTKSLAMKKMVDWLTPFALMPIDEKSLADTFADLAAFRRERRAAEEVIDQYRNELAALKCAKMDRARGVPGMEFCIYDWNLVRSKAQAALESMHRLWDLTGTDEVRLRCGGDQMIAYQLTRFTNSWSRVTAAQNNLARTLMIDLTDNGPNWIHSQRSICMQIESHFGEMPKWIRFNSAVLDIWDAGLFAIAETWHKGLGAEELVAAYRKAISREALIQCIENDAELSAMYGDDLPGIFGTERAFCRS